MSTTTQQGIRTEFWPMANDDAGMWEEGRTAMVEVERDESDPGRVTLHTMVDGRGSVTSYYFDREDAIRLANALLDAVVLR